MISYKKLYPFKQVFHFIWTGSVSALVDLLTIYILVDVYHLFVIPSTIISVLSATIVNYVLNIKFVFIQGKHSRNVEILLFFSLAGFGLVFNVLLMWVFYSLLDFWYITARFLSIIINVVINFIIKKKFIFQG